MSLRLLSCGLLLLPVSLTAQLATTELEEAAAYRAAYQVYADSVAATLTYYTDTTVVLGDDLAELRVPPGYRFVYGEDAETVLVELWGNPPSTGAGSLGMLFPEKYGPESTAGYGIDIFFTEEGYVADDDAADYDYDELLEQLQQETEAGNASRLEQGYGTMQLVDWAATPHYDSANKRLHWAKQLRFDEQDELTLNYNIMFLGRRGYLTMNVIGGMKDLPEVNGDLDQFLGSLAYTEGNRYADFDSNTDEMAAYGVAALFGAKVLAKTGLLATIGIFLLKAWKLVLVGVVASGAGVKKFLGK